MNRPPNCLRCQRALRPAQTSEERYPDTVAHYARGHCAGCYRRLILGQPGPAQPDRDGIRVYDVDVVAIDLATHGERIRLNVAERYLAIQDLTRRNYSATQIATMLRVSTRTVQRHRTRSTPPPIAEESLAA